MNISGRRKHHICTVVIGKKGFFKKTMPMFLVLFSVLLIRIPNSVEKSVISSLALTSVNTRFTLNSSKSPSKNSYSPDITNVLKVSSPLFYNLSKEQNENVKEDLKNKKNENNQNTKKENIKEKSVISSNLKISNGTSYIVDSFGMVSKNIDYNAVSGAKKVLIVHTHGCETYSGKDGTGLGDDGSYRTRNTDKNVTSVGKTIADELKKRGVDVIYDDTLCDFPSYNSSYKKSMEVIESHLKSNPDIRFVFDIHRDAISDSDNNPIKLTTDINGQKCAQIMIVCGTDATGLTHPHWRENLTLGLKIQKRLEEKYPGLARPLNLREERFNMHKTKGSLIFEVGTHGNTLEEAQKSGTLLADAISDVICN